MADIPTIAVCSTAAAAILCITMVLAWFKDGRPRHSAWLFSPFAVAIPAGILLSYPDELGGPRALALGWFLFTLMFGAAWQCARYTARRRPLPFPALIACLVSLVFSLTLGNDAQFPEWRMLPRTLLMAGFSLLSAREFQSLRNRHLPSAQTLAWIFYAFGAYHALRLPFTTLLPAPYGSLETQTWAIASFNFLLVLQGLLLAVFMTTLGRERIALHHFQLAMVDPLTGVGNRRALDRRLAQLAREDGVSEGQVLALAVLDIDNFKSINDRFGHGFGDVVIAGAANVACEFVHHRSAFRHGGEEFAVLVEAASPDNAYARVERIRAAFAARAHRNTDHAHLATLSAGVAIHTPGVSPQQLLDEADRALYLAKALGRNRTVLADEASMARLMEEALQADTSRGTSQATSSADAQGTQALAPDGPERRRA
ncbi:diguanylate cyclase [Novosphingobium sp. BW1]|uniref:GGDEF domain-containing protein n=1 Tax=Novosphingobium sp. BW1 TaxID=2592621 RepID=UPI0011DEBCA6|nr:GGDEF domain-containing protein [Novosphingobium sp. BW1]TYC92830.1 GGDEF domain-containing protein [Novosphingobium sp. BW1]